MTQEMEQVCGLVQKHGDDLAFVVSHSGGKEFHKNAGTRPPEVPGLFGLCGDG
jgi:hypothetical protein